MRHQPSLLHEHALGQRNSAELLARRDESDVLAARHARWYARLAEPADFLHTDCPRFWPVLEIEIDNLRAAARWAIDHADGPLMVDLYTARDHIAADSGLVLAFTDRDRLSRRRTRSVAAPPVRRRYVGAVESGRYAAGADPGRHSPLRAGVRPGDCGSAPELAKPRPLREGGAPGQGWGQIGSLLQDTTASDTHPAGLRDPHAQARELLAGTHIPVAESLSVHFDTVVRQNRFRERGCRPRTAPACPHAARVARP